MPNLYFTENFTMKPRKTRLVEAGTRRTNKCANVFPTTHASRVGTWILEHVKCSQFQVTWSKEDGQRQCVHGARLRSTTLIIFFHIVFQFPL